VEACAIGESSCASWQPVRRRRRVKNELKRNMGCVFEDENIMAIG
jgi:hypothetical protein